MELPHSRLLGVVLCLLIFCGANARANGLPCAKEHPTFCGLFESAQEKTLEATNTALVEETLNDTLGVILDRRAVDLNKKEACFKANALGKASPDCQKLIRDYKSDYDNMRQELVLSLAERNFVPNNGKAPYGRPLYGGDERFDVHFSIYHSLLGAGAQEPLSAQESSQAWTTFRTNYENEFQTYQQRAEKELPLTIEGKAYDYAHHPQALKDAIDHGFMVEWDDRLHDFVKDHHDRYLQLIGANPEFLLVDKDHPDPLKAVERSLGYLAKYRAHLLQSLKDNPDLMVGFEPLLNAIAKTSPQCSGTIQRLLKSAKGKKTVESVALGIAGVGDLALCALAPESFLPCAGLVGLAGAGIGIADSSAAYDRALTNTLTGLAQKDYSNSSPDDIAKSEMALEASWAAAGFSSGPLVARALGNLTRVEHAEATAAQVLTRTKIHPPRLEAPPPPPPPDIKIPLTDVAQAKVKRVAENVRSLKFEPNVEHTRRIAQAIQKVADPVLRNALENANRILRDPVALAEYFKTLHEDTLQLMLKSGKAELVQAAERGIVKKEYVLQVLKQRAKDRGETTFIDLNTSDTDKFFEAMEKGPIIDHANAATGHGVYTHLIQRDIVAPVLDNAVPGGAKQVNRFINTTEGREVFHEIFDSFDETGNDPEFFNKNILTAAGIRL